MLCLARALLGSSYKEGVLELNASDDRCPCTPFTASMVDCKLLLMLCLTDWNLLSGASMLLMLCQTDRNLLSGTSMPCKMADQSRTAAHLQRAHLAVISLQDIARAAECSSSMGTLCW